MQRPLIGVRRDRAALYLSLTIVAFAVTVMGIRVYLDAAGYPRVGGGGLHDAQMRLGGQGLVVAAVPEQHKPGRLTLIFCALPPAAGEADF